MSSSSSSKRKSTCPAPPAELVAIIPKERAAKIRKLKKEANQLDKEMKNDGNEAMRAKILEPLVEDAAFVAELLLNGVGPRLIPLAPFNSYSTDLTCQHFQPDGAFLYLCRSSQHMGRTQGMGYVVRTKRDQPNSWRLQQVTVDFGTASVGIQVNAYGRTFGAHGRIHSLRLSFVDDDTHDVSLHLGHSRYAWRNMPPFAKVSEAKHRATHEVLAQLPGKVVSRITEFIWPELGLRILSELRTLRIAATENM